MTAVTLAADAAARTSTAEAVQFWVLAVVAVFGALGVITATKAVYSALFLAITMIVVAMFYIAQGAVFLGVAQVVVYTGAVMMLFLFVLMLVGVHSADSLAETLRGQRIAALVAAVGFGVMLIAGIGNATVTAVGPSPAAPGRPVPTADVEGLAELIFIRYLWAFELTGALLITATIGAMVLAHREQVGTRNTQRQQSRDRFIHGRRATPMPNPGVYARHNAVDMPALLPDGRPAESSVIGTLRPRGERPAELTHDREAER
ncbi:NADH-quinone oxidoreductase subunit J [Williamsia sterculiae]|uniref:NADH-quinone oxidoreductase subunit J n=1 Tax=Williamsia sterculiae TaxID=1344003 RepID=A0A1N7F7H3_9NOCA|nr:NADH-quinone oxidoreductase subunit J [Williamsia sterculiae]SIR96308.1 NADH-quinone oxidoreductase subunit J [Williamsia sterculiae]